MLLSLLLCAFNISHHKKVQNLEINNGMEKIKSMSVSLGWGPVSEPLSCFCQQLHPWVLRLVGHLARAQPVTSWHNDPGCGFSG